MNINVSNTPKFNLGDGALFYDIKNDTIYNVAIAEITINEDGIFYCVRCREYDFIKNNVREICLERSIQKLVNNLKEKAQAEYFSQCDKFDDAVREYSKPYGR